MSFSTEFHDSKESIFLKGDKECEEHAALLRDIGDVFVDPDFPPTANSLGKIIDDQGNEDFENLNDRFAWFAPHQFQGYAGFPDYGRWSLYEDPWPFHVDQGRLGDCWLIAAIQAIARRKEIVEQILPEREYTRDCGIVPVRLFVNGKWEVIKVDYHIPQDDGMTRGAKNLKN
ncbi:hypothetical protein CRE_22942 [Caenorhabditis remanei]|uniref:Calpain catalytic domain-containing protein n=1 Tax=Caenorhabditis remanei TaxID=31234 RepID=E3MW75_CAERE|nr:hypothetical protein CRE_22942 [Caenorhabditis remanei]